MTVTVDGTIGVSLVQDGTITTTKLVDGNVTPVKTQVGALPSMIKLGLANGYGTTNTCIRRFTNVLSTQGTDITYADSATLGGSMTINTAGVYAVAYTDQFNANAFTGLRLNTTQGATAIYSILAPECISGAYTPTSGGTAFVGCSQFFASGSVIRAHTQGNATGGNPNNCQFTITRVA